MSVSTSKTRSTKTRSTKTASVPVTCFDTDSDTATMTQTPIVPDAATMTQTPIVPDAATMTQTPIVPDAPRVSSDSIFSESHLRDMIARHPGLNSVAIMTAEKIPADTLLPSGKTLKMTLAGLLAGNARTNNGNGNARTVAQPIADTIRLDVTRDQLDLILNRMDSDVTIYRVGGIYTVCLTADAMRAYMLASFSVPVPVATVPVATV